MSLIYIQNHHISYSLLTPGQESLEFNVNNCMNSIKPALENVVKTEEVIELHLYLYFTE